MIRTPMARWRASRSSSEQGAVTAELAVALPSLLIVLAVVVAGIAWAGQVSRCEAAAGEIARAIARDEPPDRVDALTAQLVPADAEVSRSDEGDLIVVTVRWAPDTAAPAWARLAPDITVAARAVAP